MKLNIKVNCSYICEPIRKQDGRLLAVELLSRFSATPVDLPIDVEKFINELDINGKRFIPKSIAGGKSLQ